MKRPLLEHLQHSLLVGDGAMGTLLLQHGVPVGTCLEQLNRTEPQMVSSIHTAYIKAGAQIVETNTFGAHRDKLARYGLAHEVAAINREAVAVAREAAGHSVYVAGTVGSIAGSQHLPSVVTDLESQYTEQMEALLESNVDALLLETFLQLEDLLLALKTARQLTTIPVICQLAIEQPTTTLDGFFLHDAMTRLLDAGAQVIGFNCRVGPSGTQSAFEASGSLPGALLSAYPNAGLPEYVDGTYVYRSTPEYFAQSALRLRDLGVRLIGGCCGTTPAHIAAIAESLRGLNPVERRDQSEVDVAATPIVVHAPIKTVEPSQRDATALATEIKSREKPASIPELARTKHTIVVELDPPVDLNYKKYLRGAMALKEAGVDAITLADNSLAVTRMSNMALGALIMQQVGIRPIVHMACRDRNTIGQQSHLMGLHALGIDHILAITGDPARLGDIPGASSVYDTNSVGLLRMIQQLNNGMSFSGKPLKQRARFTSAAAFNPNVRNLDKVVRQLERKIEAGADFIMTQPVFDPCLIERIHDMTKHLPVPIFLGIWPLPSSRNAEYLHNELPGIQIADDVRRRMAAFEGEKARAEGVAIAKELLDVAMAHFNGIYLMTPLFLYGMTVELTQYVLKESARHQSVQTGV